MTPFWLNLRAFFDIHSLKSIYKNPNKILGEMSLVCVYVRVNRSPGRAVWLNYEVLEF